MTKRDRFKMNEKGFLCPNIIKSNRPKISPGGIQYEKIENPQTLPEYRSG